MKKIIKITFLINLELDLINTRKERNGYYVKNRTIGFKFLSLITLLFFCSNLISAQVDSSIINKLRISKLYWGIESGRSIHGKFIGTNISLMLSNKWGGSFEISHFITKAKETPTDYIRGSFSFPESYIPFYENPIDDIFSYSFRITRQLKMSLKDIKLNIECGPSYIDYRTCHFYHNTQTVFTVEFLGNYYYRFTDKYSIGLSSKFKLTLPSFRFAGLEVAAVSNINANHSYLGAEIELNLGYLRKKMP